MDIKFPTECKMVSVNDLIPYAKNPKDHTDKDLDLIIKSIQRNGWGDPILVCPETNEILSGNGRYLAAKKIGLSEVPVVYAPDGLTEKQKADLVIASNKLVEVSGYNKNLDLLISEYGLSSEDFGIDVFDDDLSVDEQKDIDIETKKIKISFLYKDSYEIIDKFIREMNEKYPELLYQVEIND
jgi:hypothetical protein